MTMVPRPATGESDFLQRLRDCMDPVGWGRVAGGTDYCWDAFDGRPAQVTSDGAAVFVCDQGRDAAADARSIVRRLNWGASEPADGARYAFLSCCGAWLAGAGGGTGPTQVDQFTQLCEPLCEALEAIYPQCRDQWYLVMRAWYLKARGDYWRQCESKDESRDDGERRRRAERIAAARELWGYCARRWVTLLLDKDRPVPEIPDDMKEGDVRLMLWGAAGEGCQPRPEERRCERAAEPPDDGHRRACQNRLEECWEGNLPFLEQQVLREWLLVQRMDLPEARRLEAAAFHQPPPGAPPGSAAWPPHLPCRFRWCIERGARVWRALRLWLVDVGRPWYAVPGALAAVLLLQTPRQQPGGAGTWADALIPLLLALVWVLYVFTWPRAGRVWAPRLLAASVVGWVAMTGVDWPWQFATELPLGPSMALGTAALLASLGYLHTAEVCRHVRALPRVAWCRAAGLLLVGWFHSLAAGTIGMTVVSSISRTAGALPPDWGIRIWPKQLLLLSCLALLLGIVAQTLWEREAVTEPL